FERHQRRRYGRRAARPGEEDGSDPGWRRQGPGFFAACRAGFSICTQSPADRPRCAAHRGGAQRQRRAARGLRLSRASGREGAAQCCTRRRRAPVTSLRELGHVPRLPSPRRGIRRHGEEAAGVSRTYVFARSAPSAEYDRSLAWAALLLAATGLVMVYSSSIATAEASGYTGNNAAWFLVRHGTFLAAALLAAITVFLVPARLWQHAAPALFLGGVALLVLVLMPGFGREVNGARRWSACWPPASRSWWLRRPTACSAFSASWILGQTRSAAVISSRTR